MIMCVTERNIIAAQPQHRRRDIIRCIFHKAIGMVDKNVAAALSAVAVLLGASALAADKSERESRDRAQVEKLMWQCFRALGTENADTYTAVYTRMDGSAPEPMPPNSQTTTTRAWKPTGSRRPPPDGNSTSSSAPTGSGSSDCATSHRNRRQAGFGRKRRFQESKNYGRPKHELT
jgi:hypothetical protein